MRRRLQIQFFFSYSIIGSVGPLMSVYLHQNKGLTTQQVGHAGALTNTAYLISPILLTLLADTRWQTRDLLGLAFLSMIGLFAALVAAPLPWITLMLMGLYGLAIVALFPLQDGLVFAASWAGEKIGQPPISYPSIRVWGTIGFLFPVFVTSWLIKVTHTLTPILWCGMGFALVSAVISRLLLPKVEKSAADINQRGFAPTVAALRALWSPRWWSFTLGLMLATLFGSTYHAFFPIYLSDHLKLDRAMVPYVINLGVLLEIGYTLIIPWWQRRWGLNSLIIGGVACMMVRLFLLANYPSVEMSLLVQIIHGWEIMALFVAPVMVFNRLAGDSFRNSMQGAFAMMMGLSRVLGNLWGGYFVEKNIFHAYHLAGWGGMFALIVVIIGCHRLRKNTAIQRTRVA